MKIAILLLIILLVGFMVMTYASNKKTERQPYRSVQFATGYEVRYYPALVMATVKSSHADPWDDRNNNFRKLAGYIFGKNEGGHKIPMTAPVLMEQDSVKGSTMSFVMPARYQDGNLPIPADSSINIHKSTGGYYAVITFGGFAGKEKIRKKEAALSDLLKNAGITTTGNFIYMGYNAPWELIGRENEIMIRINFNGE